jgi:hypothetical protein
VYVGALEYEPSRGAAIAPHIDDSWIWGGRIVTCSLLSCSIMEFIRNNRQISVALPPRSVLIMSGWFFPPRTCMPRYIHTYISAYLLTYTYTYISVGTTRHNSSDSSALSLSLHPPPPHTHTHHTQTHAHIRTPTHPHRNRPTQVAAWDTTGKHQEPPYLSDLPRTVASLLPGGGARGRRPPHCSRHDRGGVARGRGGGRGGGGERERKRERERVYQLY